MKRYLKVLKKEWFRNEFAFIFAMIAFAITLPYVGVAFVHHANTGEWLQVTNGWLIMLPVMFGVMALVHTLVRPAVLIAYNQR